MRQAAERAVGERLHQCTAPQPHLPAKPIMGCVREAEEALDRLQVHSKGILVQAYRLVHAATRERKAFRFANRCHYTPREATPQWVLGLGGGAAVPVDGPINAWAFAEGSMPRWLGGLYQAMIVAAIDASAGIAAGIAMRNLFRVRMARKAMGGLAAALYPAFPGWYTLLGAHFREALASVPETATGEAVARRLDNPLAIHDFATLLLAIASLGLAAVAVLTIMAMHATPIMKGVHRHDRSLSPALPLPGKGDLVSLRDFHSIRRGARSRAG